MSADSQYSPRLTPYEDLVYSYLQSRHGCIVAYEEFRQIGVSFNSKTFSLANYVAQLRRKIDNVEIYNVHGVGYMLRSKPK